MKFPAAIENECLRALIDEAIAYKNRANLAAQTGNVLYAGLFARKAAHFGIEYMQAIGRWETQPTLFVNERTINHATQNHATARR